MILKGNDNFRRKNQDKLENPGNSGGLEGLLFPEDLGPLGLHFFDTGEELSPDDRDITRGVDGDFKAPLLASDNLDKDFPVDNHRLV